MHDPNSPGMNPEQLALTDPARDLLSEAEIESSRLRHDYIATEHLALALLRTSDSTAAAVLTQLNVDRDQANATLGNLIRPGREVPRESKRPFTSRTKMAFSYAADFAREIGDSRVGPEHILIGIMREQKNPGAQILQHHGVTEQAASDAIRRIRGL